MPFTFFKVSEATNPSSPLLGLTTLISLHRAFLRRRQLNPAPDFSEKRIYCGQFLRIELHFNLFNRRDPSRGGIQPRSDVLRPASIFDRFPVLIGQLFTILCPGILKARPDLYLYQTTIMRNDDVHTSIPSAWI